MQPSAVSLDRHDRQFFGHPRGLSTLFFTELWERFSYYGMRALLILFMTAGINSGGLGFGVGKAGAIYGLYTALVFGLGLPGGWIADRIIGQRRSVLYGGIVIALGHFSMAVPTLNMFYLGLALIVIGTGLLKPNISTMVGQLYPLNDPRRDAGFSLYYMGINIGALISPVVCGWLGERVNWHYGFGAAGVGMTFGLIQYVRGARYLGQAGLHPVPPESPQAAAHQRRVVRGVLIFAACAAAALALLQIGGGIALSAEGISNAAGLILTLIVVVFFVWLLTVAGRDATERKRMVAIFVLFVAAALFWAAYEQAGSTLNLFAERNTRLTLWGFRYPASWFQSVNSLFLIPLAPVFAWLWVTLGSRNPTSTAKFSLGLIFVGLGFAVLIPVASHTGVSPFWLTLVYFLHTVGELLLSPVGLSAMTKLAPARIAGLMMGVWFLATSVGDYISGRLASFYESFSLPWLFGAVAAFSIVVGLALAALIKPMKKLMSGVN